MRDSTATAEKQQKLKEIIGNSQARLFQGRKGLITYLNGNKLTQNEAIIAKCYDCMGYYADGKMECKIPTCPLYPLMPYNPKRQKAKKTVFQEE